MATADLRPMTIGEVLDRTFRLYKNEFWLFTGIMALPFLVLFFFNVGIAWIASGGMAALRGGNVPTSDAIALIVAGFGGAILLLILTFVLTGAGQAASIFAISDIYLGRPASIRSSFQQVRGHILQVIGTIFIVGLAVGAGFILLFIPGIILACRTAVAVPVAVLEDAGPGTAFSRSMDLTKGFAMQIFLIFILTVALTSGISALFTAPFLIMQLFPTPHQLPFGMVVLQDAASFVAQVLVAPIQTIAFSLMYYNLRVRKEGFDLEHLVNSLGPASTPTLPATDAALPS